jgi:PAS domain S-box-containing protein
VKLDFKNIWESISKQGDDVCMTPSLRRKLILCNRLAFIGALLSVFYFVIHILGGWQTPDAIVVATGIGYASILLLNAYKKIDLARVLFILLSITEVFVLSNLLGREAGIEVYFFPILVLSLSIFESREKAKILICSAACLLAIFLLHFTDFDLLPYKVEIPINTKVFSALSWLLSMAYTVTIIYQTIIANNGLSKHIAATETLNHLMNAIPNPTFIKDMNEQYIIANDAYKKIIDTTQRDSIEDLKEIQLVQNGGVKTLVPTKVLFKDESGEDLVAGSLMDITDIRLAQEKIQHIQEMLKDSQEKAHIGSWEHLLETGETEWSEEALKIFEFKNLKNPTFEDLHSRVHQDDIQKHKVVFDRYIKKGEPFNYEEKILSADGSIKHIFIAGKPLMDEKGNIEKLIGSVIDITEKKQAEIALVDYKNLFSALIQNSSDIATIIDVQGNIIYQSPSFYRLIGYNEKEVINESIFDFIHPEDRSNFIRFFSKVLHVQDTPLKTEIRFQLENGHWLILEAVFVNMVDDPSIGGIIINSRDITERKTFQFENTDKSQMLTGVTSNMPVMIYKINQDGCFQEVIGEGMRLMGYKDFEFIGKKAVEIFPDFQEEIFSAYDGDQVSFVSERTNKGKTFYFENYIFPDSAREGGIIGFALDVTDKKLSEKRQKEYSQELERINNNLDQFAYIVSHDLKAPLRAISHLVEWIEEDIQEQLTEESTRNMKMLKERVQKMQALIKGILEYAKASKLNTNFEDVDVNSLIKDVVGLIGVPDKFKIDYVGDFPVLSNSKVALEQIFSNLISNAVKYHNKENGNISIGYSENKKFHEFFVEDDGPGILKEYHNKIFEIFQTLQSKEKVDSTGVGLAIVKKVIEEQGGRIWVASDHGKGAKFIFSIPKKIKVR